MIVVVGAVVGFLAGRLIWTALKPSWQRKALLRQNFNGVTLPTAGGIVIFLTIAMVEAGRAIAGAMGVGDEPSLSAARAAVLVLAGGFAFLGLLDDLAGREDVKGAGGHVRALLKGELTSGGVKLIGGLALSFAAAAMVADGSAGLMLVADALVIALAANLANLFDLRPGRMTKVSLIGFVVIVVASGFGASLVPVAIAIGAAAALLIDDLHERVMMGDTGANVIGAILGLGIVSEFGNSGVLVALAVLLGFNALSEFVSFSKVIDSVPPLRAFDMLGRRRQRKVDVREEDGMDGPIDGPPSSRMSSMRATVGGASERKVPYESEKRSGIDLRDRPAVDPDERGDHW